MVCGKGNNGGDGFVIARTAAKDDWNVTVFLAEGEPKTADAILNFERLHSPASAHLHRRFRTGNPAL